MICRYGFSKHIKLGKKRKFLNRRTIRNYPIRSKSILIIDLDYLAYIFTKKLDSKKCTYYDFKKENYKKLITYKKPRKKELEIENKFTSKIIDYLISAIKISNASEILVLKDTNEIKENIRNDIKEAIEYIIYNTGITIESCKEYSISEYLFNFFINDPEKRNPIIVTNSMRCWGLSYYKNNASFIYYTSAGRPIVYNNKTGLDFLSRAIKTDKIINKLGLDDLKYISLQYLYVVLLYIKFLYHKNKDVFYFDAEYFNKDIFYGADGIAYEYIIDAHKMLSYVFMTKPEILQLFLYSSTEEFDLNLKRLLKLTEFDRKLMLAFKSFISQNEEGLRKINKFNNSNYKINFNKIKFNNSNKRILTELFRFLPELTEEELKKYVFSGPQKAFFQHLKNLDVTHTESFRYFFHDKDFFSNLKNIQRKYVIYFTSKVNIFQKINDMIYINKFNIDSSNDKINEKENQKENDIQNNILNEKETDSNSKIALRENKNTNLNSNSSLDFKSSKEDKNTKEYINTLLQMINKS